jgi:hypothetical protein
LPRKPPGVKANGGNTIQWPGVYGHVLRRKCEQDAVMAARDYLTLPEAEVPEWERENAECAARLYAERDGKPVRVQSHMLPDGMPAPMFSPFPCNRGMFTISPDDVVTFWPRRLARIGE